MPKRKRAEVEGRNARAQNAQRSRMQRQLDMIRTVQYAARQPIPAVTPFSCGSMDKLCTHCHALRFQSENSNCCHNGKVQLPPLSEYPAELQALLTGQDSQSKNFKDNIRQYNSGMAFASFGANIDIPPSSRGPYSLRIHGQIYHRTGSLHPPDNSTPVYSQLYIMDSTKATDSRMQHPENASCRRDIFQLLANVLNTTSPYAAAYKHMRDVEKEQNTLAASRNISPPVISMHLKRGQDQRRYNEPTHDEVAAIFISSDGAPPANRDIVVYPKDQTPRSISYMSANCDPMVYPLLFPRGDLGWCTGMQHSPDRATPSRNSITHLQFYSYRLACRNIFSPIFHAGKLLHQYAIDAYVKTEASRLDFIRRNQANLRVELYQGLMDHIQSQADIHNLAPGKVVVLPSTFQGSPRAMQQNFQDAMSIVAKFGRPDLFLTFTCNPRCQDITQALPSGQQAHQRPDIVARVFKLHLKELLKDITVNHVLGVPIAHVHVIEFQKRGLPHCHLLIILSEGSKLRDGLEVDTIISSEIPDRTTDPDLYEVVKSCMVHGPCGTLNPACVCMADGKCTKDYPKEFRDTTVFSQDGYPLYRRRDDGRTILINTKEVDNRWIVPYNPYLSKKFKAHINLEACSSVKSVKYLFKYVYKGHDCASVEVSARNELTHDEIKTYIDTRYVSAPEAFWRLSEYPLHQQSHAIVRLPVHLPDKQPVYFLEGRHEEAVDKAATRSTKLTAFFELNMTTPQPFTYNELPHHFVFDSKQRKWKPRKTGGDKVIGRIYFVSPRDIDRFCLRLLLLHVPGPNSYEHLRTVNGEVFSSFKEACIVHNLLNDDSEWNSTLQEAALIKMPSQLRSLFATICNFCDPSHPLDLWTTHRISLIEDFMHVHHLDLSAAEQRALAEIQTMLLQNGRTCSDIGLPDTPEIQEAQCTHDSSLSEEELTERMSLLNEEQSIVVQAILQAVRDMQSAGPPKCRAFFLDGPGGSGKTMVYNTLISYFKYHGIGVASTAWTGIAATLLTEGRTVHNLFKLPVPIVETSTCNITPTSKHADFLRSITCFIIDEASMVMKYALTAIDAMLQDITGINVPFGGKVFLLGGDFRQVLPVVPRSSRTVIVENCLKQSGLWPNFTIYKLTKNMRARSQERSFAHWLLCLGNDTLPSPLPEILPHGIEIPDKCTIVGQNTSIVNAMFSNDMDPQIFADSVILAPTNEDTLALNNEVLKILPGNPTQYLSADRAVCDSSEEAENYPTEFLNSLTPSGMPPHRLLLKEGAIVMLLRNLDILQGLCNGTRLIIKRLHKKVLDAQVVSGSNAGHRVLIPRIKLAPSDVNLPFTLERTQFPIRLAYSMTINKSQGQTFQQLGIYLPTPVFAHGQLYVAFSRAKSFSDIYVKINPCTGQGLYDSKTITQNVVYKEVL